MGRVWAWWFGGSDSVIAAAVGLFFLAPLLAVPGMLLDWLMPATSEYSAAAVATMIGMIICLAAYALVAVKALYHALSGSAR
jgi:hypothetical protein